MHGLVTGLDRRHDLVPLALDVGAVGVEADIQTRLPQHLLAGRDVARDRDPDPDRHHAEIGNHLHRSTSDSMGWFAGAPRPRVG